MRWVRAHPLDTVTQQEARRTEKETAGLVARPLCVSVEAAFRRLREACYPRTYMLNHSMVRFHAASAAALL